MGIMVYSLLLGIGSMIQGAGLWTRIRAGSRPKGKGVTALLNTKNLNIDSPAANRQ